MPKRTREQEEENDTKRHRLYQPYHPINEGNLLPVHAQEVLPPPETREGNENQTLIRGQQYTSSNLIKHIPFS